MLSSMNNRHRLWEREKISTTFPPRKGAASFSAPILTPFVSKLSDSEASLPSVCPLFVLPSAPVLLATAPSRTPPCLSVCHQKPVRYCGCGELCSHVADETHRLEPLVHLCNSCCDVVMRDTLAFVSKVSCVCACVCALH